MVGYLESEKQAKRLSLSTIAKRISKGMKRHYQK